MCDHVCQVVAVCVVACHHYPSQSHSTESLAPGLNLPSPYWHYNSKEIFNNHTLVTCMAEGTSHAVANKVVKTILPDQQHW